MLRLSKILVSFLALVPLFSFALMETHIEPPKVAPFHYSEGYIVNTIEKTWGVYADTGLAIAKCESGYNNLAINENDSKLNGFVSRGLFQISEIHGENKDWWKPEISASVALSLFKKEGVRPWYNCSVKLGFL